ncbi:hypothetical protein ACFU99_21160 [Streptomyces sp. NPDC057654]|uniref:hypothetical protein n=1 Tax=Streptomyces sp. NPDC057654 TaxID=3346196 RepID=UPI003691B63D
MPRSKLEGRKTGPAAAWVVVRIFAEHLAGIGLFAIAQRLTADSVPCPSAYDRKLSASGANRIGLSSLV